MRRTLAVIAASLTVLAPAGAAVADHPAPGAAQAGPPLSTGLNAGGEGAEWNHLSTILTGNPHTDLDFFTQGGNMYAAVGTLAIGPNAGGQTIVQLTEGDEVAPAFVSSHPSAACVSNPADALGLQHDVEATPKGEVILNTDWTGKADRRDAQLIIDATDAPGRCHDQGTLGLSGVPQGGLEIIDITDIENPVEIGLTSHIGEAHTVNVDPKRPHIAYAVTSDSVSVGPPEDDPQGDLYRKNEDPEGGLSLDGFEIVDLSTCMDFPEGTSVDEKRERCRPDVYRFRYQDLAHVLGHTNKGTVYGCHELEVYPDDTLTCASGQALLVYDMSRAFDDNGTPNDYTDDRPRGEPLPCAVRDSTSVGPFATGAKITDCVVGEGEADLSVSGWQELGAPSLEGVRHAGTAFHMGRESATGAADPAYPSSEDIDFDHETEFTHSKRFVLATDERGGGVLPPGASCSPGLDNPTGNGGIHAYQVDALKKSVPESAEAAFESYARTPDGAKAIFRAPIQTGPQATECTAHVFHQIPGQNRIFMGWYSQGTQVVDFIEHPDGTFEWKHVAWFVPENANTWTSAIFKFQDNGDGTFTYWGATGDFSLGNGRDAVDVYEVTLPAPAQMAARPGQPAPEPPADGGDEEPAPSGGQLPTTGGGIAAGVLLTLTAAAAIGRRRRS